MTDLLVYSVVIPVIPFQLEALGYSSPSALTAYLLLAYVGSLIVEEFSLLTDLLSNLVYSACNLFVDLIVTKTCSKNL